jgi:hypothetical protein
MCNATQVTAALNPMEAMKSSFGILFECNEVLPRTMGDDKLRNDVDQMNYIIRSMSNDSICTMKQNTDKKANTIINLYATFSHFMQYFKPWLLCSVSLRMVEITMKSGLCSSSPTAFAYFGGVLLSIGQVDEGRRLGK